MTEVGILGLTTTLSVVAFLTDSVFVLPIIAGLLVVEVGSVIIQLLSKKFRHKKTTNELYLEYLRQAATPNKPTKEELLACWTKELEDLAAPLGLTGRELYQEAEYGGGKIYREEHFDAICLTNRIGFLKKMK